MMQVTAESQPRTLSRPILAILAGGLVVFAIVALVSQGDSASSPTSTAVDSSMYTLAGFRVTVSYKCIFPTCTDFWCDANCNHRPVYCPASFCKKIVTKTPLPRPPPPPPPPPPHVTAAPTPAPTPAPTCKAVNQTTPDMSECHATCITTKGQAKANSNLTAGSVAPDQCTNCFCAGCTPDLFTANCGGVYPTVAACTPPTSSCCPSSCMGGEFNIRPQMCTNCQCAGCLQALFGKNCGGKVPQC